MIISNSLGNLRPFFPLPEFPELEKYAEFWGIMRKHADRIIFFRVKKCRNYGKNAEECRQTRLRGTTLKNECKNADHMIPPPCRVARSWSGCLGAAVAPAAAAAPELVEPTATDRAFLEYHKIGGIQRLEAHKTEISKD